MSILEIVLRKFQRLVLGLVGLIDAKAINVAQPIWLWGCLTWAKTFIEFGMNFNASDVSLKSAVYSDMLIEFLHCNVVIGWAAWCARHQGGNVIHISC